MVKADPATYARESWEGLLIKGGFWPLLNKGEQTNFSPPLALKAGAYIRTLSAQRQHLCGIDWVDWVVSVPTTAPY